VDVSLSICVCLSVSLCVSLCVCLSLSVCLSVILCNVVATAVAADWDNTIDVPSVSTAAPPDIAGQDETVGVVISVGAGNTRITFDQAIQLTLAGESGKRAYFNGQNAAGNIVTQEITVTCTPDFTQASLNAQLSVGGVEHCKINLPGGDLGIGTIHFSSFGSFSISTATPSTTTPSVGVPGPKRGGGGGGGGGGGAVSGGIGGVISPFHIKEISYDKCDANMAWITIQANGLNPLPDVKLRTSFSGVIGATLADEQPYEAQNEFDITKSRFVYEAHFSNGDDFFIVIVEDIAGRTGAQVKKAVQVVGCKDTIIVTPDGPDTGIRTTIEAGGIISELISIATPLLVMQHIGDATTITNENTGLQLTNYQTLQSGPDKYAEIILGIEGQTITTIAMQDRFGLPESNNNANVFLQISHTGSEINSMRGVELGSDKIMIISGDGVYVELPKSAEI